MSNLLEKMLKLFSCNYEMLYEKADEERTQEQVRKLAYEFDHLLDDKEFAFAVRIFNDYREDIISSDREAAAFLMTKHQMMEEN